MIARELMMVSRAAHVLQRTGLAMAGAMAGTFVAAQLAKSRVATFDSIIFLAMMILVGVVGFYLGIDVPRSSMRIARRIDVAQLLSAGGIFLAALAALVSVYGIVFDEVPPTAWELVIGSCWIVGVAMLASAGLLGRLRLAKIAAISIDQSGVHRRDVEGAATAGTVVMARRRRLPRP